MPYIHDLFLITRPGDLNARAKLYMAKPFALAVRRYPRFLVNSLDTARKLRAFCRSDAKILTYRPRVRNVFGVNPADRASPPETNRHIRLISLGTVEPRKNYPYAARIIRELRSNGFAEATLEIVGRTGWGDDRRQLEGEPGVILTGYLSSEEVRHKLQQADALLCTSHEEGLGLPLLEAQYAGLPIIAPDDAVFREVLAESGVFIDRLDCVRRGAHHRFDAAAKRWTRPLSRAERKEPRPLEPAGRGRPAAGQPDDRIACRDRSSRRRRPDR